MEEDNKKNRNRIVSFDEALRNDRTEDEDSDEYTKKVKKHKIINRLAIIVLFLVLIGVMAYLLIIRNTESYSSIGFEWEQEILTSANQQYINFDGGILQYGPEGASYYTAQNKKTWAVSYTMSTPKAICQQGYALIYDQGAKTAVIMSSEKGQTATITTEELITKGTVSAYGVAAFIQENELANDICFYDGTGAVLDITVHTLVSQSGYPVDIAFSPDGQMIMASFVYIDSGITQNQIVFYNFDEQRSTTGVVGAFRKYGDSLFADVAFLNNDRAVALGDGVVVFYNLKNKTAPEELKVINFEENITNATYGDSGLVIATRNGELSLNHKLYYYDVNGEEMFSEDSDFDIRTLVLSKNGLYLVSDTAVCFINSKGKTFFKGSLECDIIKLNNSGEENELLFITNRRVVFLKLFRG